MNTKKREFIDPNELMRYINENHCYSGLPMDAHICTMELLTYAPRVDAVEVVHGRWVIEKRHTVSQNPYMDDNYHAHATCSECGFCIHSENASFGYPKLNTTNYCPNCGAKMDLKVEA